MALLSVIRRWRLRDGLAIREIARRTGLSRNTIRKYLGNGVVEPKYPERHSPSKLDSFAPKLAAWLKTEAGKNRKQRRNLRQIYTDLTALGYAGSYDRVAAFARHWRQAQQEAARTSGRGTFVPLTFAPGEAFQFDWSEDWASIAGTKHQAAGRPVQAGLQPGLPSAGLSPANPRDAVRCAQPCLPGARWRSPPRHLRQYEDGGGSDSPGQSPAGQRPLPGDGQPLPVRSRVLQPGLRLGERPDREERAGRPPPDLARGTGVRESGSTERLAGRALQANCGKNCVIPSRPSPLPKPGLTSNRAHGGTCPLRRVRRTHQAASHRPA